MDSITEIQANDEPGATPLGRRILPDILAFAIGLALAYYLEWETTDLVWSLWLCSLVLGYTTILVTIASGGYILAKAVKHIEPLRKRRKPAIIAGVAGGLFFLGFFSLHFCGFHAGHSVFLNQFFPIDGLPNDAFGAAFMNPPLLWSMVFTHLLQPYGMFIIPALIAERKHVFRPLIGARKFVQTLHRGTGNEGPINMKSISTTAKKQVFLHGTMAQPYINVVRMHLLIFFFAISHYLKIDTFTVYAVVYSVYFFPWAEIGRLLNRRRALNFS